jgi:hypothetical protein
MVRTKAHQAQLEFFIENVQDLKSPTLKLQKERRIFARLSCKNRVEGDFPLAAGRLMLRPPFLGSPIA